MQIDKEEYDYLKYIEHEYSNLSDEINELINNTMDLYAGVLKFDNDEVVRIIERYFREEYKKKEEELKNERQRIIYNMVTKRVKR